MLHFLFDPLLPNLSPTFKVSYHIGFHDIMIPEVHLTDPPPPLPSVFRIVFLELGFFLKSCQFLQLLPLSSKSQSIKAQKTCHLLQDAYPWPLPLYAPLIINHLHPSSSMPLYATYSLLIIIVVVIMHFLIEFELFVGKCNGLIFFF